MLRVDKVKRRDGLSTPYRLTKEGRLLELNFIHTALNLFILDAGILIMVKQVRLMMFSLNMVVYPMFFLSLDLTEQVEGSF